jgi:hypothetical protein
MTLTTKQQRRHVEQVLDTGVSLFGWVKGVPFDICRDIVNPRGSYRVAMAREPGKDIDAGARLEVEHKRLGRVLSLMALLSRTSKGEVLEACIGARIIN